MVIQNSTKASSLIVDTHDESFTLPLLIIQEIILGVIFIASISGNFLVCWTVWQQKIIRKATWCYIFSLAVSDIAVTLLSIPLLMYTTYDVALLHNHKICQYNGFCLVFFFLTNLMTLAVISFHKFLCIQYPLYWKTNDNSVASIVGVWIVSSLIAAAPILGWSDYYHIPNVRQCMPGNMRTTSDNIYIMVILFLGFIIPLITMIFCYTTVYFETKKHSERLKRHTISDVNLVREADVLMTVIIVVVTFVLCWSPFAVCLGRLLTKDNYSTVLLQVAFFCGYAQSALNPIIYALRHEIFRKAFRSAICCSKYRQHNIGIDNQYTVRDSRPSLVGFEFKSSIYNSKRNPKNANGTDERNCKHQTVITNNDNVYDNLTYEP